MQHYINTVTFTTVVTDTASRGSLPSMHITVHAGYFFPILLLFRKICQVEKTKGKDRGSRVLDGRFVQKVVMHTGMRRQTAV